MGFVVKVLTQLYRILNSSNAIKDQTVMLEYKERIMICKKRARGFQK